MGRRQNKYNARKVVLFGYTFDSQAEGERYLILREMEARGEIANLEVHPRFQIQEGFKDWKGRRVRPIHYVADFQYYEGNQLTVEDVKGFQTAVFRLKRKLFLYQYPHVVFRMVKKGKVIE